MRLSQTVVKIIKSREDEIRWTEMKNAKKKFNGNPKKGGRLI
jgi:hypothetical protein